MSGVPAPQSRPLLDTSVAALLVFALGVTLTVFAGLVSDDPDYARAKYSIWPAVALGGWAVALLIANGVSRSIASVSWRIWWTLGLAAYALHLCWGFGIVFGADFAAVYAGQGVVVASVNFALFVLWAASAIACWVGGPAAWLTIITAVVLVITTLTASIIFGRDVSPIGGAIILVVWLGAIYFRLPERGK